MNSHRHCTTLLLGAAIACALSPTIARADVAGVFASAVDAYFGSQNDTFQAASPFAPTTPSWGILGTPGVPFGGSSIMASATPPAGPPSPFPLPAGPNPFGGAGYTSIFQDGSGNIATSTIQGSVAVTPTGTYDDAVVGVTMSLTQVGTLSYAYEELDYSIDFSLVNNVPFGGGLAGVTNGTVTRMFNVSGTVGAAPGSFVEFGGQMDFYEISGGIYQGKALGSLDFYFLNTTPGPFTATVSGTGFIGGPNGALGDPDRVRITGSFFVAGDPSTINVQSVPEPSALGLLGLGALGLLGRNRRRA